MNDNTKKLHNQIAEKEKARRILMEQYELLAEVNKECEPEHMGKNCEVLTSMYLTLFENQEDFLWSDKHF